MPLSKFYARQNTCRFVYGVCLLFHGRYFFVSIFIFISVLAPVLVAVPLLKLFYLFICQDYPPSLAYIGFISKSLFFLYESVLCKKT